MTEQKAKAATKKVAKSKAIESTPTSKPETTPEPVAAKPQKSPKKVAANKPVEAIAVQPTVSEPTATEPTAEERYRMVQTAAYYIAERDGFAGKASDYWIAAELEIAKSQ